MAVVSLKPESWERFAFSASSTASIVALPRGLHTTAQSRNQPLITSRFTVQQEAGKPAHVIAYFDGAGRLHREDGPATEYDSGKGDFYWHGVEVPEYVVLRPQGIITDAIDTEHNQEVRRVMIERYGGIEKYLQGCHAKRIAVDKYGTLFEKRWPDRERIRFVRVKNSTPEPDGTIKNYYLRVPPDTQNARAGIAWTFGLQEKDYRPELQT